MTFKEMYLQAKNAPRIFVAQVQRATVSEFNPYGVSESTIRAWLSGTQKPNDLCKIQLQKHFGMPFEELFPS